GIGSDLKICPYCGNNPIYFGRIQHGGRSPSKVNGLHYLFFKLFLTEFQFLDQCRYHSLFLPHIGGKMKIAIVTGLLAKRNMDVDAAHFFSEQLTISNKQWKLFQ